MKIKISTTKDDSQPAKTNKIIACPLSWMRTDESTRNCSTSGKATSTIGDTKLRLTYKSGTLLEQDSSNQDIANHLHVIEVISRRAASLIETLRHWLRRDWLCQSHAPTISTAIAMEKSCSPAQLSTECEQMSDVLYLWLLTCDPSNKKSLGLRVILHGFRKWVAYDRSQDKDCSFTLWTVHEQPMRS